MLPFAQMQAVIGLIQRLNSKIFLRDFFLPFSCPTTRFVFFVSSLSLIYLFTGLIGHDPWKQDEAYSFGIIYHIINTGDYIIPTLADEPFMEKPPLYYITAAFIGNLLSGWLPLHDAVRLTSGCFMALVLFFTGLTARELLGAGYGAYAVLILIGSFGLLAHAHEMFTDTALLAGFAIAFYGLSLSRKKIWQIKAGLLIGTGVGIGFMSKGLIEPVMIGLISVSLPLFFPAWRTKDFAISLCVAILAALPWLTIWSAALYLESPELFMEWFWRNNVGRFLGFAHLGAESEPFYYVRIFYWFAWPAWPFALLTLWHKRTKLFSEPSLQLPLLSFVIIFFVLSAASTARDLYAMPLLIWLAILAAPSIDSLPAHISKLFSWLGIAFWGGISLVLWAIWVAMTIQDTPPSLPVINSYLPMDFRSKINYGFLGSALLLSFMWYAVVDRTRESPVRVMVIWVAGITLMWGTLNTLWLPWIDAAKSYRTMIVSMQSALPEEYDCISSQGLGEPQRGMLEYVAGIITFRNETRPKECELLLVQESFWDLNNPTKIDENKWSEIWTGSRPGDTNERYRLFIENRKQLPIR